jgi:hypothetical protein
VPDLNFSSKRNNLSWYCRQPHARNRLILSEKRRKAPALQDWGYKARSAARRTVLAFDCGKSLEVEIKTVSARLAVLRWQSSNNRLKSRRTFKYRLYPNRKQRESLAATFDVCRQLYDDALQEHRDACKTCRTSVTFILQSAQLPACKEADARCIFSGSSGRAASCVQDL